MNASPYVKTIIIDDEQDAREILHFMLRPHESLEVIAKADSVTKGIEAIQKHNPELVFLDIEMQDGTGFDLLSQFPNPKFRTVFVTAHDDFAIRAFKCNALDYLLKPVEPEDLARVLKKVQKLQQPEWFASVSGLLNSVKEKSFEKLLLPTSEGLNIVNVPDIIRVNSEGSYCDIILKNGERLTVSKSMKETEELLDPENFIRVHQSHLINFKFVKKLLKDDGGLILMEDNSRIPLARRRKEEFLERLSVFVK